jgi:glucose-1-phosphate thymidylyltransferase
MNIIIPMAGMGKRMRPFTLTVPKPLIPVAGKPIVEHLITEIVSVLQEPVDEIAFIVGRFGEEVEAMLIAIADKHNAKGNIYYQDEALGTAHAVFCAKEALKGKIIIAFADTIFKADFKIKNDDEGIIWVKEVEDPRQFGVVKCNSDGIITDFIEKPQTPVSNKAIIGIYYFNDGEYLSREIKHLIDNHIVVGKEYQLTDALENMKTKGYVFKPGNVIEWLDCGNKNATVYSSNKILEMNGVNDIHQKAIIRNSSIIEPCFIGENVQIVNSVVGPFASVGSHSIIKDSVITRSIVLSNTKVSSSVLHNSLIGNNVIVNQVQGDYGIGDYCTVNEI